MWQKVLEMLLIEITLVFFGFGYTLANRYYRISSRSRWHSCRLGFLEKEITNHFHIQLHVRPAIEVLVITDPLIQFILTSWKSRQVMGSV